jgi:hypothetical protein
MRVHTLLEQLRAIENWPSAADLVREAGKFEMGPFSHFADEALWSFTRSLAEREILRTPFPSTYFEFSAVRPAAFFDALGCLAWVADSALFVRGYVLVGAKWGRFPGAGILTGEGFSFHPELASDTGENVIKATIAVAGAIAAIASRNTTVDKVPAPAALNRKRQKLGRVPLFDYHVVTIRQRPSSSPTKAPGETGVPRANPTAHWRRGHFRRLESGRDVPVAPALVGAADTGFVAGHYRFARSDEDA